MMARTAKKKAKRSSRVHPRTRSTGTPKSPATRVHPPARGYLFDDEGCDDEGKPRNGMVTGASGSYFARSSAGAPGGRPAGAPELQRRNGGGWDPRHMQPFTVKLPTSIVPDLEKAAAKLTGTPENPSRPWDTSWPRSAVLREAVKRGLKAILDEKPKRKAKR